MTKTEETLKVIKEKCEQIEYGEFSVKLYIHAKEITGFDQIDSPIIKFRAKGEKE